MHEGVAWRIIRAMVSGASRTIVARCNLGARRAPPAPGAAGAGAAVRRRRGRGRSAARDRTSAGSGTGERRRSAISAAPEHPERARFVTLGALRRALLPGRRAPDGVFGPLDAVPPEVGRVLACPTGGAKSHFGGVASAIGSARSHFRAGPRRRSAARDRTSAGPGAGEPRRSAISAAHERPNTPERARFVTLVHSGGRFCPVGAHPTARSARSTPCRRVGARGADRA
ncbi:hypothetical protein [Curtobacterium flaccumfaciens]|uniref:hypothetical protein n=1 Tax=Curtobacterium flaccumfaciens TaxID=2035 RepID=UPI001414E7C8|nr:hypothetical protein [Curtobacterium flaccumfaciens]